MRRLLPIGLLAIALAGCGKAEVVQPVPETVVGTVAQAPSGAAAGKALFLANGCGGCHTFKPAGTNGKVGPNLDNLASDAQKANQGPESQYAFESIKNPSAYVVPGFSNGVMPNYGAQLKDSQIADLVAFLTKKS